MIVVYLIILAVIQAVTVISSCQQPGTFMHIGTIYGNRPRNRYCCQKRCSILEVRQQFIFFVPQDLKKSDWDFWGCLWI